VAQEPRGRVSDPVAALSGSRSKAPGFAGGLLLSVQSLGLTGADDRTVLAFAAEQQRVLVTQDIQTVTRFAFERVDAGLPMPGVIEIVPGAGLGAAIEDLALAVESYDLGDLDGQVIFVPL